MMQTPLTTKQMLNLSKYCTFPDKASDSHTQYITSKFINSYENMFGSITSRIIRGKKVTVHSTTADNPYAYFNGKTWKWAKSKKSNPRYKKAVKASVKYLKYFGNKKVKSYKLKY